MESSDNTLRSAAHHLLCPISATVSAHCLLTLQWCAQGHRRRGGGSAVCPESQEEGSLVCPGSQGSDTARGSSPQSAAPASPLPVGSPRVRTSCPLPSFPPGSQEPLVPSGRSRSLGGLAVRAQAVALCGGGVYCSYCSSAGWVLAFSPAAGWEGVCARRAPGSGSALPVWEAYPRELVRGACNP
ncbi:hypothetical protein NDU88_008564 [Pleurodeles waltl]|uniref:Uncharacterized protein n=1 Tax=Pleurodeles waltl TaxID=8319 RepID=A0AAV7PPP1_PLEWA|nr:hypothetical protein NDU88_008564 [Pleurodeles waltl]